MVFPVFFLKLRHGKNLLLDTFSVGLLIVGISCLLLLITINSSSNDWHMWRYDANRSASSPEELPDELYLQWVREYPKSIQAWENPLNQDLMQFDKVYEPVVEDNTLFIGSSVNDRVVALNTETGKEKWRFYVDGPVRFPLVASDNKVYFVSDDGYLYCLDSKRGSLIWKFRGGPSERKILGNSRLISTWPARGGPVLKDDIIYFAAGIWPFMGIFIYALDADTGELIWENDSTGSIYMLQPHNSPSYAGVAPQGSLVVSGDKLLVPCGRSVPACFDRYTGKLLYYHLARYNKTGGAFVCSSGDFFINYHRDLVTNIYRLSDGNIVVPRFGKIPVMTEDALFSMGDSVIAYKLAMGFDYKKSKDKETQEVGITRSKKWIIEKLWECQVDASGDLIKAGDRLYAGGKNIVSAIDIPSDYEYPRVSWRAFIEGTAERLVAADNKLFVVTLEGSIYAFGDRDIEPRFYPYSPKSNSIPEETLAKAESILKSTKVNDGYCLAYELENGDLVEALAQQSDLHIIAVDEDADKVEQLRKRFDEAGVYGKRISVHVGTPLSFPAPKYLASLTVFEKNIEDTYLSHSSFYKKIYQSVRPYGGVVYLPVNSNDILTVTKQIQKSNLPKAEIRKLGQYSELSVIGLTDDNFLLLIREGSLPGAADWTHQYGNIANTVKSDDQLVKLPLGILWFGGSSNMDVLPRHGHGPPEQVIGGRLFIEGIKKLSARDVYTGRVLWKKDLPNMDTFDMFYDATYQNTPLNTSYNQVHIPGANARSSNFVATLDKIYVAQKDNCLVLDSGTGETLDKIKLPIDRKTGEPAEWGYIGVYKDYLIAGAGYFSYTDLIKLNPGEKKKRHPFYQFDISSSKKLVVMDRHTGEIFWTRKSKMGFRHSAIAVGNDTIFCIDMVPPAVLEALKRRGKKLVQIPKLMALDLRDGKKIWEKNEDIFGTWLSYSEEYDVLLQAGRGSRDMLRGEPTGMSTYKGKDGTSLWSSDVFYGGPCMLHGDTIITDRYAYSLLTGEPKMRKDPLTGEKKRWEFRRNYGCNYAIASEHLLTFRSAAAGFCDLDLDSGTGNFGGFKSGCTSNLIAANGVLNAPDYTRTCSCSYQNQSSLALIHMPEVEMWTTYFNQHENPAISSSNTAIAFADLQGNFSYVNKAFLKLWGYNHDSEVLGRSALDLWYEEEDAMQIAEALIDSGKWTGEFIGIKKDKSAINVHISAKIVPDENGNSKYMMASFIDVTNQKSTEAVKHPDLELKTSSDIRKFIIGDVPIKTVGLNLGAPGDRRAANGTLWIEYPHVGEPSVDMPVIITPDNYQRFIQHSSKVQDGEFKWIAASGVKGIYSIKIRVAGEPDEINTNTENNIQFDEPIMKELKIEPRKYTVRLYFAEPEDELKPGQRVFDIQIQGEKVLENFDIVREAGGPNRSVIKEFKNILVEKDLTLTFIPSRDIPLICGIEILAESVENDLRN